MAEKSKPKFLSRRLTAERYDVCPRTIKRWLDDPTIGFPRPMTINEREFFDVEKLDEFDRKAVSRANAEAA